MNVLERMKINDTERKIADFKVKQHQDYDFKVAYTIKKDSEGKLYTTKAQRTGCSMCGFGIQKERTRPHRFDLLYQRNPKEWAYWMENVGFGKCFDWIGFNWRQPFIPGEPAWIPQETMKNIIDARKGNQLSFFEQ